MYLLRELTEMSLPRIGNDLGGRDHTTVMHAVRKGERTMAERQTIFNQVTELDEFDPPGSSAPPAKCAFLPRSVAYFTPRLDVLWGFGRAFTLDSRIFSDLEKWIFGGVDSCALTHAFIIGR